jgi:hypothetical protein
MKFIQLFVIFLLNVIALSETFTFGPLTIKHHKNQKTIKFILGDKREKHNQKVRYVLEFETLNNKGPKKINDDVFLVAFLHIDEEKLIFNIDIKEFYQLPDIIFYLNSKGFNFKVKFYSLVIGRYAFLYGDEDLSDKLTGLTIDEKNSNLKIEYEDEVLQAVQRTKLRIEANTVGKVDKRVVEYTCIAQGCAIERKLLEKLWGIVFK